MEFLKQIPITAMFNIGSGVFPLILGVVMWRKIDIAMRILVLILGINVIGSVATIKLASTGTNNMVLFHGYILIVFPLITLLFAHWDSSMTKSFHYWLIPAFLSAYLIYMTSGLEDIVHPPKYTLITASTLIAVMALWSLFRLSINDEKSKPIISTERFWVSLGMFSSFSSNILVYSTIAVFISRPMWSIHDMMTTLGHTFYVIGMLHLWK